MECEIGMEERAAVLWCIHWISQPYFLFLQDWSESVCCSLVWATLGRPLSFHVIQSALHHNYGYQYWLRYSVQCPCGHCGTVDSCMYRISIQFSPINNFSFFHYSFVCNTIIIVEFNKCPVEPLIAFCGGCKCRAAFQRLPSCGFLTTTAHTSVHWHAFEVDQKQQAIPVSMHVVL